MDWAKTTARRDDKHLSFGIRCASYQKFDGMSTVSMFCWSCFKLYCYSSNGRALLISTKPMLYHSTKWLIGYVTCGRSIIELNHTLASPVPRVFNETNHSWFNITQKIPREALDFKLLMNVIYWVASGFLSLWYHGRMEEYGITKITDAIKWKHFPSALLAFCYGSPVNSPRKGQWRGALVFSLICA